MGCDGRSALMTTTDEMALASASTLEPARTTALGQVPNGALVGARAADSLRDIDGHRYRDDGKCCEQQNSYTAADVAQETGCRVWRWRSVSLWQESDVVKVDLRLESSVPLPRAMRRLPAGGLECAIAGHGRCLWIWSSRAVGAKHAAHAADLRRVPDGDILVERSRLNEHTSVVWLFVCGLARCRSR